MSSLDSIIATIKQWASPRIEAGYAYKCVVVVHNTDGTLDLKPVNSRLPGLSRVPASYGIPGITKVRVQPGAVCYVEFAEGDMAQAMVTGWGAGVVEEMTIDAKKLRLADGDRAVARIGDLVAVKLSAGGNSGGPIVYTGIPDVSPLGTSYGAIISASDDVTTK